MNILVINENPLLSRLIEICLSRMGCLVTLVNSYSKAMEFFSHQAADVVFCDTIMSDPYVESFLNQPPKNDEGASLPIILLKNPHTHGYNAWENLSSVKAVLIAPFTTRELVVALQSALPGENIHDYSTKCPSIPNP